MMNVTRIRPRRHTAAICPLVLISTVFGCGDDVGYPHATVTGQITIDGEPVPKGYVTISPTGSGQGPVTGGKISDGAYRCEKVPVGPTKFTFTAEALEMDTFVDALGATREVPRNILPPKYLSGIDVDVTEGEMEMNFEMENGE